MSNGDMWPEQPVKRHSQTTIQKWFPELNANQLKKLHQIIQGGIIGSHEVELLDTKHEPLWVSARNCLREDQLDYLNELFWSDEA